MTQQSRLIVPEDAEDAPYPYRPVWLSLLVENAVLFALCVIAYLLAGAPDDRQPGSTISRVLAVALVGLPAVLWFVFSVLRERAAPEPRRRLIAVLIVAVLAGNAVVVPLAENVFHASSWLEDADAITRVVGYTFTWGVISAAALYLVVYYMIYPGLLRTRSDGVAYGAAAGIGLGMVLSLQFALNARPTLGILAAVVFMNQAMMLAAGIFVGFGLAELRFGRPTIFFPALMTAVGSLLIGLSLALRASLANAPFRLRSVESSELLGLGFSVILLAAASVVVIFFTRAAERREQEARPADTA